jgi:hypothetical protein
VKEISVKEISVKEISVKEISVKEPFISVISTILSVFQFRTKFISFQDKKLSSVLKYPLFGIKIGMV